MSAEIHTEEARIPAKSVFKNWGEQADMLNNVKYSYHNR